MVMSAEYRPILHPFISNGDVSIWVRILEWDIKHQTNNPTLMCGGGLRTNVMTLWKRWTIMIRAYFFPEYKYKEL